VERKSLRVDREASRALRLGGCGLSIGAAGPVLRLLLLLHGARRCLGARTMRSVRDLGPLFFQLCISTV
jgi:hypothetical protein